MWCRSSPLGTWAVDPWECVCPDAPAQATGRPRANPLTWLRDHGLESHRALGPGTQQERGSTEVKTPCQGRVRVLGSAALQTASLPQVSGIPYYESLSTWMEKRELAPT